MGRAIRKNGRAVIKNSAFVRVDEKYQSLRGLVGKAISGSEQSDELRVMEFKVPGQDEPTHVTISRDDLIPINLEELTSRHNEFAIHGKRRQGVTFSGEEGVDIPEVHDMGHLVNALLRTVWLMSDHASVDDIDSDLGDVLKTSYPAWVFQLINECNSCDSSDDVYDLVQHSLTAGIGDEAIEYSNTVHEMLSVDRGQDKPTTTAADMADRYLEQLDRVEENKCLVMAHARKGDPMWPQVAEILESKGHQSELIGDSEHGDDYLTFGIGLRDPFVDREHFIPSYKPEADANAFFKHALTLSVNKYNAGIHVVPHVYHGFLSALDKRASISGYRAVWKLMDNGHCLIVFAPPYCASVCKQIIENHGDNIRLCAAKVFNHVAASVDGHVDDKKSKAKRTQSKKSKRRNRRKK